MINRTSYEGIKITQNNNNEIILIMIIERMKKKLINKRRNKLKIIKTTINLKTK